MIYANENQGPNSSSWRAPCVANCFELSKRTVKRSFISQPADPSFYRGLEVRFKEHGEGCQTILRPLREISYLITNKPRMWGHLVPTSTPRPRALLEGQTQTYGKIKYSTFMR